MRVRVCECVCVCVCVCSSGKPRGAPHLEMRRASSLPRYRSLLQRAGSAVNQPRKRGTTRVDHCCRCKQDKHPAQVPIRPVAGQQPGAELLVGQQPGTAGQVAMTTEMASKSFT